jgi:hypothetical protein
LNLRLAYWRFGDMDIIFKERGSLFFGVLKNLRRLECRVATEKFIVCQTVKKYFPLGRACWCNSEPRVVYPRPLGVRHTEKEGLALDTVYSIQSASI